MMLTCYCSSEDSDAVTDGLLDMEAGEGEEDDNMVADEEDAMELSTAVDW